MTFPYHNKRYKRKCIVASTGEIQLRRSGLLPRVETESRKITLCLPCVLLFLASASVMRVSVIVAANCLFVVLLQSLDFGQY